MTRAALVLPPEERRRLEGWARAAYPREACGCLVGSADGALVRVHRALPGRNLERDRAGDRYELDPADLLAAEEQARAGGLRVVGIWHTHPGRGAEPSDTDRAGAWEEWSYLIAAVGAEGVTALRSWRLADGEFREQELR